MKTDSEPDWIVAGFDRCKRRSLAFIGLFALLFVFTLLGSVFHEMIHSEWRLKAAKQNLYTLYCHSQDISPEESRDICDPARKIIERSAFAHAAELTAEWCLGKVLPVAYCKAHPDMCMIWGTKVADVLESLVRWLPVLLPMLAPVLMGMVWRSLMNACRSRSRRKPETLTTMTTTTSPNYTYKQIEGLKTE